MFLFHARAEFVQEGKVRMTAVEDGAADNHLRDPELDELRGTAEGADATPDTDLHFVVTFCSEAKFVDEFAIVAFAHGCIQIDYVEPGMMPETFQEAEDIGDGEFAAAAVNELHGLAALQVNTGNQHGRRTLTPALRRNSLSARMDWI